MPKKVNIANVEVIGACDRADELFQELQNIAEEIRAGRCDEITDIQERIRSLVNLARIAADAGGALLYRQAMHQDRENLRKELEERLAAQRA